MHDASDGPLPIFLLNSTTERFRREKPAPNVDTATICPPLSSGNEQAAQSLSTPPNGTTNLGFQGSPTSKFNAYKVIPMLKEPS